jgi:membrane fusion protein, multidrug efflux system
MTEGIQRSGETPPHGPDIPESIVLDRTGAEEEFTPPRRSAATRPASPASDARTPPTRPVFKRPLWLVVAVIALSIVALAGGRYYSYWVAHTWTDDAYIEGHIIQISPKVAGHVLQVYVADNQEVQQDALLLEIDPRDYAARLTQARAVLQ